MKVGLFLDVDKTLTKNFIQQEYAKLLGCENDYRYIESEFQNGKISSLEFGERIIDILVLPGFPWVADLLMSFPEGTNEGYGPIFSDSRADRALVC